MHTESVDEDREHGAQDQARHDGQEALTSEDEDRYPGEAATAISEDQATRVPPPDQMLPICPMAANVVGSIPAAGPSAPASDPVSGRPVKPEPSRPATRPTSRTPKEVTNGVRRHVRLRGVDEVEQKGGRLGALRQAEDGTGEVTVADEEESGDRQHDAHRLEGEHQTIDDVLRADVSRKLRLW